jgi:hypothetical protein
MLRGYIRGGEELAKGNDAIIDYADAGIAGTRLTIGPDIATMTDREIIDMFNGILAAQERLLAAWDKTVIEEPPGEKQIDHHEDSDQWVPRGDVLRCIIDDGGPEGEVTIHIDCRAIPREAEAREAEEHHCPCGGHRDSSDAPRGIRVNQCALLHIRTLAV